MTGGSLVFGRNVGARNFVLGLFMKLKSFRISSDLDVAFPISGQTEIIVKTSLGRPIWLRQIPYRKAFPSVFLKWLEF